MEPWGWGKERYPLSFQDADLQLKLKLSMEWEEESMQSEPSRKLLAGALTYANLSNVKTWQNGEWVGALRAVVFLLSLYSMFLNNKSRIFS